ncbi:phosphatidylinositol-specific phospholipase C/glycerophosphodiester phosphodiesterase family protein [Paenibacillus chibensis]|uniref:phosphatidylinositol-specific phospholipase C/glycerophosphodiester phosphodiesterase family protein n=1 Tax=Paenibacillus chibensis TaxID=59846 RepID=UPI000FD8FD13|nr:phosphatidylinositol-specific phospholipase C/glycerophosphodiester phosphodiesterase family protein [Paenibacillus chibensis]MEC0370729.1 phosphatidylinositol-specific phospholipase C/glycerophosphodiester phosphodiesterase family protein [Paenibacillus chibensis]
MRRWIALILLVGAAGLLCWVPRSSSEESSGGFTDYQVISHAMGGIHDHAYTNSYEAFIANYEKGNHVFEVDLLLTEDGKLVARHEWTQHMTQLLEQEDKLPKERQAARLSYEEFKESKILGAYDPLSWSDIMDLMERYPDIYIVTDTKEQEPEDMKRELEMLVHAAKERNPELLERVVPQIYNQPMLKTVQDIYSFPSLIYTLYATKDTDEEVIEFVGNHEIDAVTIPEQRVTRAFVSKLKKAGAAAYVNTINKASDVSKLKRMGVTGVYSDFLTEKDVESTSWLYAFGK